jgi:aspartyl-tRNA(Asn)/glutamyl-tRNA(Gln) amidotransferase subunit A
MARTVQDVAGALSVMAGPNGFDPYAMPVPVPQFEDLDAPLVGLRVGWCAEGPFAPVAKVVQETVARAASTLEQAGCLVEPVSLASWEELPGQSISLTIYTAEVSQYLAPYISGREEELSPPIRSRLEVPAPSAREYQQALADCERLRHDMARYFTRFDLLLCPISVVPAHPHGAVELEVDGQRVMPRNALRAAVPFDLTGSPAISVPFGWSEDGLPIGVQLVARHFDEATLLRAAKALEVAHSPSHRRPPVE